VKLNRINLTLELGAVGGAGSLLHQALVVVLEQAVAGEDLVQVDVVELGGVASGRLGVLGGERHSHQGGEQNDLDLHLGGLLSGDELMQIVAGRPLLYSGGVCGVWCRKNRHYLSRGEEPIQRGWGALNLSVCDAPPVGFLFCPSRARGMKKRRVIIMMIM
jgi:hypothetical protein